MKRKLAFGFTALLLVCLVLAYRQNDIINTAQYHAHKRRSSPSRHETHRMPNVASKMSKIGTTQPMPVWLGGSRVFRDESFPDAAKEALYPTKSSLVNPEVTNTESRRPRLMCMVFTTPPQWADKGRAVLETWASRCHVARFFYSRAAGYIPEGTPLDVPEGREHLTGKTMEALKLSFAAFGDVVDWFLKADDDTYVIMENLLSLLARFDPSEAHYIGGRSMDLIQTGYNGGGAGYSLSRAAAQLVVQPRTYRGGYVHCKQDGGLEDFDMGHCLARFRVFPIDSRDALQRLVFHADHPLKLLAGDKSAVSVYTYRVGNHTFGNPNGIRVLSPDMISLHYMDSAHMYMYDFLLYGLRRQDEYRDFTSLDDREINKH